MTKQFMHAARDLGYISLTSVNNEGMVLIKATAVESIREAQYGDSAVIRVGGRDHYVEETIGQILAAINS